MSAAVRGRELYAYWRVLPGSVPSATAALRAWHDELEQAHPGLSLKLSTRHDDRGTTLMEIHTRAGNPPGVDEPLFGLIASAGEAVTAPFRDGKRHVEGFDPLD